MPAMPALSCEYAAPALRAREDALLEALEVDLHVDRLACRGLSRGTWFVAALLARRARGCFRASRGRRARHAAVFIAFREERARFAFRQHARYSAKFSTRSPRSCRATASAARSRSRRRTTVLAAGIPDRTSRRQGRR